MDPLLPSDPIQVDSYSLTGRLGSGGFGVVFAATTADGRQVALKLLRPELSDDQRLRTRLGREADALRRVGGDRNVEIFDVVTEGDRAYLVMEFVEGETLAERVADQGPLVGPMLWFAAQGLVEALQAIHEARIIHRDLKPSNVMYGPDGIKVLDFGISVAAEETGLTQTGAFLGTAAWISPEQVLGRDVTEATDVFTLGMVLAFAASGRHPYGEGRADAVMYRITNTEPDLEGIQSPLREAVERCMSLDPTQRPTIDQLADFFGSNGDDSLPDAPTMGPVAGGTSIVQPDELAQRLGPRADDSKDESDPKISVEYADEGLEESVAGPTSTVSKKRPKKRIFAALAGLLLLSGGGAIAAILVFSQQDDEPIEIAAPATTAAPTTTAVPTATTIQLGSTTTKAPTTTTKAPTTTTKAPTTTIRLATPTTVGEEVGAILRASYRFRESSQRVERLQEVIRAVTGQFISADGIYGPGTRTEHIRALNKLGLSTSRVPAIPVVATTTTAPLGPQYRIYQIGGKNSRWGPCQGSITVGVNPNYGYLSPELTAEVGEFLAKAVKEVASLTAMPFAYSGVTSDVPSTTWEGRTDGTNILFYFGPPGASHLLGADAGFEDYAAAGPNVSYSARSSVWNEITDADIHVNSDVFGADGKMRPYDKLWLMHFLGGAVGLDSFERDEAPGEIMSWASFGSGSYTRGPDWGPGDKIGFGLIGPANGCF